VGVTEKSGGKQGKIKKYKKVLRTEEERSWGRKRSKSTKRSGETPKWGEGPGKGEPERGRAEGEIA